MQEVFLNENQFYSLTHDGVTGVNNYPDYILACGLNSGVKVDELSGVKLCSSCNIYEYVYFDSEKGYQCVDYFHCLEKRGTPYISQDRDSDGKALRMCISRIRQPSIDTTSVVNVLNDF